MAKDYAAISKKIVENIGGVENIASVTHCMTRLRFVVKDEGKINDAAVKATDGVMGVVNQGGQYQIIIGNHVEEAYNEVLKMGDFGEASQVARGEKKEPLTLKKVGNNILDAIVGTMSPLIPAIIGGSMVKLLVMLLGMAGVLSADGETYKILNTIGDAAFYFLPVMVAASASKKFNTNMFIAIAIAGLMLHPDFRTMMEAVTVGDTAAHFLGIPVVGVKYTYTVIPALCMTWILSYIERAIDKITPASPPSSTSCRLSWASWLWASWAPSGPCWSSPACTACSPPPSCRPSPRPAWRAPLCPLRSVQTCPWAACPWPLPSRPRTASCARPLWPLLPLL